jgi:proteic killer suppression protein
MSLDLPGLRFQKLKGKDRNGFAVWVSENWRMTFAWSGDDAIDVDLEDYH